MDYALAAAEDDCVLFLQDDMQFVRQVSRHELETWRRTVNEGASPFLFPAFHLSAWLASSTHQSLRFDSEFGLQFRTHNHPLPGFSDVCVISVPRLRSANWSFTDGRESAHSKLAYARWGPMASLFNPFVAFTPFPRRPRFGRRALLQEPLRRRSPTRLNLLSEGALKRLSERDPETAPLAESFLTIASPVRRALIGARDWQG